MHIDGCLLEQVDLLIHVADGNCAGAGSCSCDGAFKSNETCGSCVAQLIYIALRTLFIYD